MASVGEQNLALKVRQCWRLINLWTNDCDVFRMIKQSSYLLEIWKFGKDPNVFRDITAATINRLLDSLELVLEGSSLEAPCRRTNCEFCTQTPPQQQLKLYRHPLVRWFSLTAVVTCKNRAVRIVQICCRFLSSDHLQDSCRSLAWLLFIISRYTTIQYKHYKDVINDVICTGSHRMLIEQYCQHSHADTRRVAASILQDVKLAASYYSTSCDVKAVDNAHA